MELLKINELCQYLKMPRSSIYALVQEKSIPFLRIGRLIRFKREEIDSWLESLREGPVESGRIKKILAQERPSPYTPNIGRPDGVKPREGG